MTSLKAPTSPPPRRRTLKRSSSQNDDPAEEVFKQITNNGNTLTQEQFVKALSILKLNLSIQEAQRLFLQHCDRNGLGLVDLHTFCRAVRDNIFLSRIVSSFAHQTNFPISSTYNYAKTTALTYTHPSYTIQNKYDTNNTKKYDVNQHGSLTGDFIDVRKTLDYSWHPNYTLERQKWQDVVVKDVAQRHSPGRSNNFFFD